MKKLAIKVRINFKNLQNLAYWVFVVMVFILGITVLASTFNLGGLKIYSVRSGSMSPKVLPGSLAITFPNKSYDVGDIITFHQNEPYGSSLQGTITHRIIEKRQVEGGVVFVTKGDHNPSEDTNTVRICGFYNSSRSFGNLFRNTKDPLRGISSFQKKGF